MLLPWYAKVSRKIKVSAKTPGTPSNVMKFGFIVQNKENQQWIWLALDLNTREIVGCYGGARSQKSAQKLGESLPPVYRQGAVCYTDF